MTYSEAQELLTKIKREDKTYREYIQEEYEFKTIYEAKIKCKEGIIPIIIHTNKKGLFIIKWQMPNKLPKSWATNTLQKLWQKKRNIVRDAKRTYTFEYIKESTSEFDERS